MLRRILFMGLRNPVECSKTRCLGYSRQVPLFMNARCWISYDDDPDEYMRKKELAKKKAGLKKERTKMKNLIRAQQKDARRKEKDKMTEKKKSRQQRHSLNQQTKGVVDSDDEGRSKKSRKQRLDEMQAGALNDLSSGDLL